jgi:hypothetical protein
VQKATGNKRFFVFILLLAAVPYLIRCLAGQPLISPAAESGVGITNEKMTA